jgi:hypothetical protein
VNPGLLTGLPAQRGCMATPFGTYVYYHGEKQLFYGERRAQWMFPTSGPGLRCGDAGVVAHVVAEARRRGVAPVIDELVALIATLEATEPVPNTDTLDHAGALGDGVEVITADGHLAVMAHDEAAADAPTLGTDAWHAIGIARSARRDPGGHARSRTWSRCPSGRGQSPASERGSLAMTTSVLPLERSHETFDFAINALLDP